MLLCPSKGPLFVCERPAALSIGSAAQVRKTADPVSTRSRNRPHAGGTHKAVSSSFTAAHVRFAAYLTNAWGFVPVIFISTRSWRHFIVLHS